MWAARLAWIATVFLVGPAVGHALVDRSRAVQLTGTVGCWAWWFAGLVALLLPTCPSLTATRMIVPGSILVATASALAGADALEVVLAFAASLVASILVMTAPVGEACVQSGAYGDETRLPLRPPGPLLLGPIPILWLAVAVATVSAPLLLAAQAWVPGALVAAAAIALSLMVVPRFHRLALRWLVFVPAGVVVHDRLVLAETAMFPLRKIASLDLAPAGTDAADLTGTALGPAVEIGLSTMDTVVLAPTREKPGGTALHVHAVLVSPTRPGRTVAEADRRGVRRRR